MSSDFTTVLGQNALAAQAPRAPLAVRGAAPESVTQAAKQFESQFLSEMLKPMFEGLSTDGMFGGGSGEQMFRSLLVDEYGKQVSRQGGVGIAEAVQKTLLRMQEV